MAHLFVFLTQAAHDTVDGTSFGPFQVWPQSIGAWIAVVMSSIALWAHIKQRAAKSVDLDGLGGRVGALEKAVAELKGKVESISVLTQGFIATQTSQSERVGRIQGIVEECEEDEKELRREALARLDRIRENQAEFSTRLTRVEERIKITP